MKSTSVPSAKINPQTAVSISMTSGVNVTLDGLPNFTQTVGASGPKNIATFKVQLKTALRPEGGKILITSPNRISSI